MRKLKFLLTLLLLCAGVSNMWAATRYKVGERVSTLENGQKYFIFNTAYNGTEKRTGLIYANDNYSGLMKNTAELSHETVFDGKYVFQVFTTGTDNVYNIKNVACDKYVDPFGACNNSVSKNLTIEIFVTCFNISGANCWLDDGTIVNSADITFDNCKVFAISGETGDDKPYWNGNAGDFARWSSAHPFAFYSAVEGYEVTVSHVVDGVTALTETVFLETNGASSVSYTPIALTRYTQLPAVTVVDGTATRDITDNTTITINYTVDHSLLPFATATADANGNLESGKYYKLKLHGKYSYYADPSQGYDSDRWKCDGTDWRGDARDYFYFTGNVAEGFAIHSAAELYRSGFNIENRRFEITPKKYYLTYKGGGYGFNLVGTQKGINDASGGGWVGVWNTADFSSSYCHFEFVEADMDAATAQVAEYRAQMNLPVVGKRYYIVSGYSGFETHDEGDHTKKAAYLDATKALWWQSINKCGKSAVWTFTPTEGGYTLTNEAYPDATVHCTENSHGSQPIRLWWLGSGQFNILDDESHTWHTNGHGNGKGKSGSVIDWDGGAGSASSWRIVEVEDEISIPMNYNVLKEEAEELIMEALTNEYSAITPKGDWLVTDANKISSPKTHPTEGAIANLIDDNFGTYWHSDWSNPGDVAEHYLQFDLGDQYSTLQLMYGVRDTQTNFVTAFEISASNNATGPYIRVHTIENVPTEKNVNHTWTFNLGAGYRYIRVWRKSTNSGSKFWHASKMNFKACDATAGLQMYTTAGTKVTDVVSIITNTTNPTQEDVDNLQAKVEALRAYVNSCRVYTIKGERGVLCSKDTDADRGFMTKAELSEYDASDANQKWALVEKDGTSYLYNLGAQTFGVRLTFEGPVVGLSKYAVSPATKGVSNDATYTSTLSLDENLINISTGYPHAVMAGYNTQDPGNRFTIETVGIMTAEELSAAQSLIDNAITLTPLTKAEYQLVEDYKKGLIQRNYGEGLGKYSYKGTYADAAAEYAAVLAIATGMQENPATLDKAQFDNAVSALRSHIVINKPTNGMFLKLKSANGQKYLSSTYSTENGKITRPTIVETEDNTTTWCFAGGKLVSYNMGGALNSWNLNTLGVDGASVEFNESPRATKGRYTISCGGDTSPYLYNGNAALDRGQSVSDDDYTWTLEEVTALPVTLNAKGFGTLNLPVTVSIPEGVAAWYAEEVNGNTVTMKKISDGVLPAGTPVILHGTASANLTFTVEGTATAPDNRLKGTVATITTESARNENDCSKILVMSVNRDNGDKPGLYNYAGDNIKGFKAYLPYSGNTNVRLVWGDMETAIEAVENSALQEGVMYNLNGQRVQKANGIVIVNGKKYIVK